MAVEAVAQKGVSIALACRTFGVSERCYRYESKLKPENERIGDLLIGLTNAHRTWGFGLCYLHLRNVKGYLWNHKRVYRIYRELELNLRIKPRKRLKREKPEELAVPAEPNVTWSLDFMADRLEDASREAWDCHPAHPARQAPAECVHRALQSNRPARVARTIPVSNDRGGEGHGH